MILHRLKFFVFALGILASVNCSDQPSTIHGASNDTSAMVTNAIDSIVEPAAHVNTNKPLVAAAKKDPAAAEVVITKTSQPKVEELIAVESKPSKATKTVFQSNNEYYASKYNLKPTGEDQSAEISRVLESIPNGGTFVFDTGPEFIINSSLRIRNAITIVGRNTQLTYQG